MKGCYLLATLALQFQCKSSEAKFRHQKCLGELTYEVRWELCKFDFLLNYDFKCYYASISDTIAFKYYKKNKYTNTDSGNLARSHF